MLDKQGYIKNLKGIIISDPWYDENVKCRYQSETKDINWMIGFHSDISTDDEFPEFSYIDYHFILAKSEIFNKIHFDGEILRYPPSFDSPSKPVHSHEYIIGVDTAKFCIASKANYNMYGDMLAIHTGSDGYAGNVYELSQEKEKKEKQVLGILFVGSIDADMITEDQLFHHILSGFDGKEIDKKRDLNTIITQTHEKRNCEAQPSLKNYYKEIEDLIHIGFSHKKMFKPTVWKYANRLMTELEKEGLVRAFDFGRGKGKWATDYSIDHVIKKAKETCTADKYDVLKKYKNYCIKQEKER